MAKLIEGARTAFNSMDNRVVDFFGMEEGARRASDRKLDDNDEEIVRGIYNNEQSVKDLARSRATRLEIIGVGVLGGSILSGGDFRSRVKGALIGGLAVEVGFRIGRWIAENVPLAQDWGPNYMFNSDNGNFIPRPLVSTKK